MKTKSKLMAWVAMMAFVAIMMAALMVPMVAQAQVTPTTWGAFTNVPLVVPAGVTTNFNSVIDWRQGRTLSIMPFMGRTNAGTDTVTYYLQVTHDKTNWSTTYPASYSFAANGTTGVRGYWVVPPTTISAVQQVRLLIMNTNSADGIRVTNVTYSWSN